MKRFRFSLRAVAVVRANRELRARQALATALRSLELAEKEAAQARARAAELESMIAQGRGKGFSVSLQVSYLDAYRAARVAEAAAERKVVAAYAEAAKRRNECIEANRQVKIVSRLEERARAAHRLALMREEQAEIDEQAVFRAGSSQTL